MDKVFNQLVQLDWADIDNVRRVTTKALDELTRPAVVRELLNNVVEDQRLLDLSERRHWGDRVILFDDPGSGVRLRLHRFEQATDLPHSHRWGFTTRVLAGRYRNWLYGPEKWVNQSVEQNHVLPSAAMVRDETPGVSYTIDDQMVHNVRMDANTFSLIVRGPSDKERALRVRRDGSVYWQYGREKETAEAVEEVRTSEHRLREVLELAERAGVA
ncbi:hypothetical protein GCM10011609_27880 [Lentzea pudingi]|uniref:Uncharacterized protein n=1 Tax=Lentzea pudingi TaxID=1789439 RepID=A0ABQ2HRE5_9PSEU|nr:hypothetical protein [Lentzea pudingi]GGM89426.1 hypothetical protein GCM10011609_27880 [Lentzea pudingi]